MRTFLKAFVILLIPAVYYFMLNGFKGETNTANSMNPVPSGNRDFVHFILNNDYTNSESSIWVENQLGNYRGALNFNGIHIYDVVGGGQYGTQYGTDRFGYFQQDLEEDQITEINTLTDNISNHDLKLYWERVKISRLCYAQRIVYEVTQDQGNTTTNYGFCYRNHSGDYTTDSGRTVIHASVQQDNTPRFIAENIYENLQHGDQATWNIQRADAGTWYMKPMMRIDSTVVDNNPDAEVVRIDVVNFRGQLVKSVILRTQNFMNTDGNYGGQYLDKYSFKQGIDSLQVSGDTNRYVDATGLNNGVCEVDQWERRDSSRIDFKIHWFGQVDVWFDKMTVDDEIANHLLSSDRFGCYDELILDMATRDNFLYVAGIVKQKKFTHANEEAVNHVLNVMYSHLKNTATLDKPYTLN